MPTPSIPQKEPQDSKDAKNSALRESLITTLKKSYEKAKDNSKDPKPKRASLIQLRDGISDPDNSFQIWKYPS